MHPAIRIRLSSWREMFKGKIMALIGAVWFAIGLFDLVKTEVLPERFQSYTVVQLLAYLSWRTWLIVFLVMVIGVLLEGGHAAIEKRNKQIAASLPSPENIELSLKEEVTESRGFSRYKLVVKNKGPQISNVKVNIVEPKPPWMNEDPYAKYNLHFPFRLWRPQIGPESDGCSINKGAPEVFYILHWWEGSDKNLRMELADETVGASRREYYQMPAYPWTLNLRIEWAGGHYDSRIQFRIVNNALKAELDQGSEFNARP